MIDNVMKRDEVIDNIYTRAIPAKSALSVHGIINIFTCVSTLPNSYWQLNIKIDISAIDRRHLNILPFEMTISPLLAKNAKILSMLSAVENILK